MTKFNIDEIKSKANIVNIIGDYVDLKRAGRNYKGLCPFHREKTPSFVVSEEKQVFKCFGCGESGDVISFLMKRDNLEFIQAVELLADKLGIELERGQYHARDRLREEKLFKINELAMRFYYQNLLVNSMPRQYLKNRGIDDRSINNFYLGYASDRWDDLCQFMASKKVEMKDLLELGLVGISKKGNPYDRLRNRIVFPIIDTKSRIIGFGGRTLGDDVAKYINSPDSLVYNKGHHLYGLNILYRHNDRNRLILVEGYMDVIALHQQGYYYAVASLGTALTTEQAKLIKRFSKDVYIVYDSDNAGIKAADKAISVFESVDVSPRVVTLEKGMDPDDFIRTYGKEQFEIRLANADHSLDFRWHQIQGHFDNVRDPQQRTQMLEAVLGFLAQISSHVIRDDYIQRISDYLVMDPKSLRSDLDQFLNFRNRRPQVQHREIEAKQQNIPQKNKKNIIFDMIMLSLSSKRVCLRLREILDPDLFSDDINELFDKIESYYRENETPMDIQLLKEAVQDKPALLSTIDEAYAKAIIHADNMEEYEREVIDRLIKEQMQRKKAGIATEIHMLMSLDERTDQQSEVLKSLLNEVREIDRQLKIQAVDKGGV